MDFYITLCEWKPGRKELGFPTFGWKDINAWNPKPPRLRAYIWINPPRRNQKNQTRHLMISVSLCLNVSLLKLQIVTAEGELCGLRNSERKSLCSADNVAQVIMNSKWSLHGVTWGSLMQLKTMSGLCLLYYNLSEQWRFNFLYACWVTSDIREGKAVNRQGGHIICFLNPSKTDHRSAIEV